MRAGIVIAILIGMVLPGWSQPVEMGFRLLRQQDDLSALRDTQPQNAYERLKWIPLRDQRSGLSFGGSYRFQTEGFVNEEFDRDANQTDLWFLHRAMLHGHFQWRDRLEVFGELHSSFVQSKANPSPVDQDHLSVNQLYVRYRLGKGLHLNLGRMNLREGSGRLIDVREGPNARQSFDLVALRYEGKAGTVKAWAGSPVAQQRGVFDNRWLRREEWLATLYASRSWSARFNSEAYLIYKEERDKSWDAGTNDDRRLSVGTRLFGDLGGFRYNNETLIQVGQFGDNAIRAWTLSFDLQKDLRFLKRNWVLEFKTEAISGERGQHAGLNTFDGLYPRGAYFGRVARFGPSNLLDLHPGLSTSFGNWELSADYVAFWRFSTEDGLYNPALILTYPSTNSERFIAHQIGTISSYSLNQFIALEIETNLIFPGPFLRSAGLDDHLFHSVFTAEFKF